MQPEPRRTSFDWYIMLVASGLLILRFLLRLMSGPPELGQAPSTERIGLFFTIVMIGFLGYGLATLSRVTAGREDTKTFTAIVFALGIVSGIAILILGD